MQRLQEGDREFLLKRPESGMGYQILWIRVSASSYPFVAVALNAELLVVDLRDFAELREPRYDRILEGRPLAQADMVRVWVPEYAKRQYLFEESTFEPEVVETIESADRFPPIPESPLIESGYVVPKLGQSRHTQPREGFVRYTSAVPDNRVTDDGALRPGTYATTINDARFVSSGLAAAGRYARPDPRPGKYVTTIVPDNDTLIGYGTVLSEFGQAGGGVEVHFASGTGPGTAFKQYEIPEA